MRLDDGVAFGVKRHGTDGRPVASIARPASRVEFASPAVQRVSGSQNRVIAPCMALRRADVTDAAVTMINVVPMHEAVRSGPRLIEVGESLGGELRPVLGGAEQRLRIGVVITDPRA